MVNKLTHYSILKKGTYKSAFFDSNLIIKQLVCFCIINTTLVLSAAALASQTTPSCTFNPHQFASKTESATISHVYDGDTIRLTDGRKIRIIGINTPELGSFTNNTLDRRAEPYAQQAKQFVQNLFLKSKRVSLRYGVQNKDHYDRVLAHIFLADRRNVAALLIKNGLARSLHIPPNNWQFNCYAKLDNHAQQTKTGLWSHPYYQTRMSNSLQPTQDYKNSFMQISGSVSQIRNNKNSIWINLGARFVIRINKSNQQHFSKINFNKLIGQKISARGYVVYFPKSLQFRMLVRHPSALFLPKQH